MSRTTVFSDWDKTQSTGVIVFSVDDLNYQNGKEKVTLQRNVIDAFLTDLLGQEIGVKRLESGQPYIEEFKQELSISHSLPFFAIAMANHSVGIDIQCIKSDIDRMAKWFVRDDELEKWSTIERINVIWSIKEAAFKCHPHPVKDYKRAIHITAIHDETFEVKVDGVNYSGWYTIKNNLVISYCS